MIPIYKIIVIIITYPKNYIILKIRMIESIKWNNYGNFVKIDDLYANI